MAIRVPTYDSPQVRSAPLSLPRVQAAGSTGMEDVGAGLRQVGNALENEVNRFDVAKATSVEAKASSRIQKRLDQQRQLRGEEALKGHEQAAKDVETILQEETGALDDRQKEKFAHRFDAIRDGGLRGLEQHFAEQLHATEVDAVHGLAATTLNEIASNSASMPDVIERLRRMDEPIQKLNPSKEGREAARQEWREKGWLQAIESRLAAGDADGAKAYVVAAGKELGTSADEAMRKIAALKETSNGGKLAREIAGAVTNRYGWMDAQGEAKALAALDDIPEGPLHEEAEKQLQARIAKGKAAREAQVKEWVDRASTQILRTGTISGDLRTTMEEYAGDALRDLLRSVEADKRSAITAKAELRRIQADANAEALSAFNALSAKDQLIALDPTATLEDKDAAQVREAIGNADTKTINHIKSLQKKTRGDDAGATEFDAFVNEEVKSNKAFKSKDAERNFRAFMNTERRALMEKEKREPNFEERSAIRARAYEDTTKKHLWGLIESRVPRYQVEGEQAAEKPPGAPAPAAPVATPKPVTGKAAAKIARAKELLRAGKTNDEITKALAAEFP